MSDYVSLCFEHFQTDQPTKPLTDNRTEGSILKHGQREREKEREID